MSDIFAKEFRHKFKLTKTYKERVLLNIEYFQKEIEKVEDNKKTFGFQKGFLNFFGNLKNKKILLYGASEGEIYAFKERNANVYDLSYPENKNQLAKNINFKNNFEEIDIEERYFDYVFSSHVVEHISNDDIYIHFKSIKKILSKNGQYIFICPSKFNIVKSDFVYQSYHVGKYAYNDIYKISNDLNFEMEVPYINPILINSWFKMKKESNLEIYYRYLPNFINSILGVNSLYVRLKNND